ncbi:MAG: hypothetical protein LBT75_05865 [Bacilli bacterium]|nr:hypothetical protein [Bacilli bacterium]
MKFLKNVFMLFCFVFVFFIFSNGLSAQNVDVAKVNEYYSVRYSGHVRFKSNYKIPKNPGYSLSVNKYVKQAYISYTRNGKSICSGRVYSNKATKKNGTEIYKAHGCWDNLSFTGPKTQFHYGWFYF